MTMAILKKSSIAIYVMVAVFWLASPVAKGAEEGALYLTPSEQAWLKSHSQIRLAIDIDWAPFEFVDENNQYRGMAADYIALIERRLGITFQIDTERSWSEMVSAVKNRDLDAFSLVAETPQRAEFVKFTAPYLSFPMVIVTRETEPFIDGIHALSNHTVGVVDGYATHDLLSRNHPNLQLAPSQNLSDGLEAVSSGQVYAFVDNLAAVGETIRNRGLSNLKISGQTPYRFELRMAVRNDWPELVSILQKALDSISEIERDEIHNKWLSVRYEEEFDLRVILSIIGFALVAIAVVYIWNRQLKREIGQRQRVERTLRESEEKYRAMYESANVGLALCKMDGTLVEVNQAYCDILGRSMKETMGLSYWAITPRDYEQQEAKQLASLTSTGKYGPYEKEYFYRDGSRVPVLLNGALVQDAAGENLIWSVVQDVTERTKVRLRRNKETQRLQMLLALNRIAPTLSEKELLDKSLDIAVAVTNSKIGYLHIVNDDEKTINLTTWNAAALKMCTAAYDNHYPIDQAGIWADSVRFKKTVVHNDYEQIENKPGYPEGHFHVVRHMSTPVLDGDTAHLILGVGNKSNDYDDDDAVQIELVASEIQKFIMRHRAEKALKTRTEELEIAKQEAEKANAAKSEFLAAMSHDLRTPLNAIIGFSDMMRQRAFGPLGDKHYEEYSEDIHSSGTLLVSLINDVLDLSKVEAGKYVLDEKPLSIGALAQVSVRQISTMADLSNVTLEIDIPEDFPNMSGDERALIQILNNLVSNAVKFTPAGGNVCVTGTLDAQSSIWVRVSDTGIGMKEDEIAAAFTPFELGNSQVSRPNHGTGLGLPLCQKFMELFGGSLTIDSSVGHGTTVSLQFPPERTIIAN